jgi:phage FluMu protein Com
MASPIRRNRDAQAFLRRRRHHAKSALQQMRSVRCGRLVQKVEQALRPGKRLEIKCIHCKVLTYLVGDATASTHT